MFLGAHCGLWKCFPQMALVLLKATTRVPDVRPPRQMCMLELTALACISAPACLGEESLYMLQRNEVAHFTGSPPFHEVIMQKVSLHRVLQKSLTPWSTPVRRMLVITR